MSSNLHALPVFVGRQPIFNGQGQIVGFELLFRDSETAPANQDLATADLLRSAFVDIGIENLVGDRLAFINLARGLLNSDVLTALPANQTVLEFLQDFSPEPEILAAIRDLKTRGFRIALAEPQFTRYPELARELANIIRIDVRNQNQNNLRQKVATLAGLKIATLAEQIETEASYKICKTLDFLYFQGFYLSYPNVIAGHRLGGSQLVLLRLIELLHNDQSTLEEIERLVTSDAALSLEMLKLVNSPRFRRSSPIESIRQALIVLGRKLIGQWGMLLCLRTTTGTPQALEQTLIRARMGFLLATVCKREHEAERFFTLGLLSAIDRLLGVPLAEILRQIQLGPEMTAALRKREGLMALVLEILDTFERADGLLPDELGATPEELSHLYLQAISWAQARIAELTGK